MIRTIALMRRKKETGGDCACLRTGHGFGKQLSYLNMFGYKFRQSPIQSNFMYTAHLKQQRKQ